VTTTTIEVPRGTVQYSRKVSDGNYGSEEAGIFVQFDLPDSSIPADQRGAIIARDAAHAFAAAKLSVLTELGLAVEIAPDGQVYEPTGAAAAAAVFPTATPAPAPQPAAPPAAPPPAPPTTAVGGVGDTPPFDPKTSDRQETYANRDWAKARFATHPTEFFDNRNDKRNPKSPDLKHRTTGIAVWLD